MVSDDQNWKLTFHAQGMASGIVPDEKYRCNLATALTREYKGEKIKKVLAKALNLILDGGSNVPQSAGRRSPLLATDLLQRLIM